MEKPIVRILTLLGAGLVCLTLVAWAQESSTKEPPPVVKASSAGPVTLKQIECVGSQRAITFYRQKYRSHREAMWEDGPVPRVWYRDCEVIRRRAVEWRDRAALAAEALVEWTDYHYDWRSWLPRNWYLVGRCETGYGGDPNWEHTNSSFTSAFGISWREYNADAAHMGAPPWHVRHTPRDQYMAALGHYDRFGDGWTCPGP